MEERQRLRVLFLLCFIYFVNKVEAEGLLALYSTLRIDVEDGEIKVVWGP